MMPTRSSLLAALLVGLAGTHAAAQPYDFTAAETLLNAELANLRDRVAVIVRQDGEDIFRFQHGEIDFDTKTRLASFTKTLSAGVVLALRDEGVFSLDERIGDTLALFETNGLGDPTITDCFGMRHGIITDEPYEIRSQYTLVQSVTLIGLNGVLEYPPNTMLAYEGQGMQAVGRIAEVRTGESWTDLARSRLFDRCGMPEADYEQFGNNPAIAGGARSSAAETSRFAEMVINGGVHEGQQVLSMASVEQLFTNATDGLPVDMTPWPSVPSMYPYEREPDYGFGTWIFAQHPETDHVEEIVGAGAWGSYIWIDRRRGLTAVLITDVPVGTMASSTAALGLMEICRQQIDASQASGLTVTPAAGGANVQWQPAAGATGYRVYASDAPLQNVYDLRAAGAALEVGSMQTSAELPTANYFAVTALFDGHENLALTPRSNSTGASCPGDIADDFGILGGDGMVSFGDFLALLGLVGPCPGGTLGCDGDIADDFGILGGDGQVSFGDFLALLSLVGPCP